MPRPLPLVSTVLCSTALVLTGALTLSACGTSGDPGTAAPPAANRVESLSPPRGVVLSANSTAQLGTVVVDGLGFTLYRYAGDSATPSAATCSGACASEWPPVLSDTAVAPTLEGVAEDAVGTVTRPDGSKQVTLGGWPVYRHASDVPGATDGHGASGQWWAVTPDGAKAQK